MLSRSILSAAKALLTLAMIEFCHLSSLSGVSAFAPAAFPSTPRSTNTNTPAIAPMRTPLHYSSDNQDERFVRMTSSDGAVPQPIVERKAQERQAWIHRSISYYSKVMREERRRELGQINDDTYDPKHFNVMAKKHYFALRKIKDGKPEHAELIYRRIIDELLVEENEEKCDHAKLAVTTLLLALLLQREGHPATQTRRVFLHFFRIVLDSEEKCACSAKVLQAFALFEMKQGNTLKSLHIVQKAVRLDPSLRPVLKWKQFREARSQLRALRRRQTA